MPSGSDSNAGENGGHRSREREAARSRTERGWKVLAQACAAAPGEPS